MMINGKIRLEQSDFFDFRKYKRPTKCQSMEKYVHSNVM